MMYQGVCPTRFLVHTTPKQVGTIDCIINAIADDLHDLTWAWHEFDK